MEKRRFSKITFSAGSALILAVVLTSLLAIVGTIFLMAARVDKIATSAISENKELNFAVEAVVARLSHELALDVPGMPGKPEYYDYPDVNDEWLASLEPYDKGVGGYEWRQVSDVYDKFLDQRLDAEIIPDYQDSSDVYEGQPADADGDGVADSKWIELDGTTSGKGKPVYAAIRVIDNGGMINVNTAYEFDPNGAPSQDRIDGSSLTQINLKALARGGDTIARVEGARNPDGNPLPDYERECIWRVEDPCRDYLPFDISDELELRNRYFLTTLGRTRLEMTWLSTIGRDEGFSPFKRVPYDGSGGYNEDHWWEAINQEATQPDRRHFLTTYNMDRIIDPSGDKMLNINDANVSEVYEAVKDAVNDVNFADVAAQVAVNLVDFRDDDSNVTVFDPPPAGGKRYYGFESPCIYISELVHKFKKLIPPGGPIGPGGEVGPVIYRSYAIELYKPYPEDEAPLEEDWKLVIGETPGGPIGAPVFGAKEYHIEWSGTEDFHVILFEDPEAELNVDPAASVQEPPFARYGEIFEGGDLIELQRRVRANDGSDIWVTVDSNIVPGVNANNSPWLDPDENPISRSVRRDITAHKCIRRLWSAPLSGSTLGGDNNYTDPSTDVIQAHPADRKFTNVGEIGMVFRKGAYYRSRGNRAGRIGYSPDKDEEDEVRLDLADPNFKQIQQIFRYLTRLDPTRDGIDNDADGEGEGTGVDVDELKIPGRININTAPSYVIAQLPWIQYGDGTFFEKARAICDYRDNTLQGFESIGELMQVTEMGYCASPGDSGDLTGFPDLTTPDHPSGGAADDFEERDVIFARISDLVTVRSDVFTAYILVRIGIDGPQKRVIAILDRSDVYNSDGGVKVAALHPVPDPR